MSPTSEAIVAACAQRLLGAHRATPWMTAAGLSRSVRDAAFGGLDVPAERIEAVLMAHTREPDRVIRHSWYPSRRDLSVLWGHVEVVAESRRLPPLELDGRVSPRGTSEDELSAPADLPRVFISHNSRDKAFVEDLQKGLGDDIPSWICWARIAPGETIAHEVRAGVENARAFVSVVSRNSLGSIWVRKELEGALNFGDATVLVVLPCRDALDLELLELMTADGEVRSFVERTCPPGVSEDKWVSRACDLLPLLRVSTDFYAIGGAAAYVGRGDLRALRSRIREVTR